MRVCRFQTFCFSKITGVLHQIYTIFLFPRAMSKAPCLHEYFANAARVKYIAACYEVFDYLV